MYQPLDVCPGCQRHVRLTETRCPFCAVALEARGGARVDPTRGARLGRAALLAVGAALAAGGCALAVRPGVSGDAASSADGHASTADAPGRDVAAADTVRPPDAPRDAGSDARDVVDDDGGITFLYGAPPLPPDATPDW